MPETPKTRRPRPGRPMIRGSVADKPGLNSILSARISSEVRASLEAEADRTGRSISQVAERWLDEARQGHSQYHQRLGGHAATAAIEKLAEIARTILTQTDDQAKAEIALRTGWLKAIPRLLPREFYMEDSDPPLAGVANQWEACRQALFAIEKRGEHDVAFMRAVQPLYSEGGPLTRQVIVDQLFKALLPPHYTENAFTSYRAPDQNTLAALNELRRAAPTKIPELEKAWKVVSHEHARRAAIVDATLGARQLGEATADAILGLSGSERSSQQALT